MFRRLLIAAAAFCVALTDAAADSGSAETIGHWCDNPAGSIVIRRTEAGAFVARADVAKGMVWEPTLRRDGDVFWIEGQEAHGDGYRLLSNGDLELFDKEGRIRVAAKKRSACKPW